MRVSYHARQRLAERGLTIDDVKLALTNPLYNDSADMGKVAVVGIANGKTIKVVLSEDHETLITAYEVKSR